MLDYNQKIASERTRLEGIQSRVQRAAEREIKRLLTALNKRFHRHRFAFYTGNGTRFVNVEPPLQYGDRFGFVDFDRLSLGDAAERFEAFEFLRKTVESIEAINDTIEEEFHTGPGNVE